MMHGKTFGGFIWIVYVVNALGTHDENNQSTLFPVSRIYSLFNRAKAIGDTISQSQVQAVDVSDSNERKRLLQPGPLGHSEIDILVPYTKHALCQVAEEGSSCDVTEKRFHHKMRKFVDKAIHQTNEKFKRSGVNARFQLVHTYYEPRLCEGTSMTNGLCNEIYNANTVTNFLATLSDLGFSPPHDMGHRAKSMGDLFGADLVIALFYMPRGSVPALSPSLECESSTFYNAATPIYTRGYAGVNTECAVEASTRSFELAVGSTLTPAGVAPFSNVAQMTTLSSEVAGYVSLPPREHMHGITEIDVMVAYTKLSMCHEAGWENDQCSDNEENRLIMESVSKLTIEKFNLAARWSGIRVKLRMVHSYLSSYCEGRSTTAGRCINICPNIKTNAQAQALSTTDPCRLNHDAAKRGNTVKTDMESDATVLSKRTEYGADLVLFFFYRPDNDFDSFECGAAENTNMNAWAASVNVRCDDYQYSGPHEIAHMFTVLHADGYEDCSTTIHRPFRTIMQKTSTTACQVSAVAGISQHYPPRIPVFSTPVKQYMGMTIGDSSDDSAGTIDGGRAIKADFMDKKVHHVHPGLGIFTMSGPPPRLGTAAVACVALLMGIGVFVIRKQHVRTTEPLLAETDMGEMSSHDVNIDYVNMPRPSHNL